MYVLPLAETPELYRRLRVTPLAVNGIIKADRPAAPESGPPVRTAAVTKSLHKAFVIH